MTTDSFIQAMSALRAHRAGLAETVGSLENDLASLAREETLCQDGRAAVDAARLLLGGDSLRRCESLATEAVRSIFGVDAVVRYSTESDSFLLDYGGGRQCDLSVSQSGGVVVALSFVFVIFQILRGGYRRVLFLDELFTQVSAEYYDGFIAFVRRVCDEFAFDILLVSHDVRLRDEFCDHIVQLQDGMSVQVK